MALFPKLKVLKGQILHTIFRRGKQGLAPLPFSTNINFLCIKLTPKSVDLNISYERAPPLSMARYATEVATREFTPVE